MSCLKSISKLVEEGFEPRSWEHRLPRASHLLCCLSWRIIRGWIVTPQGPSVALGSTRKTTHCCFWKTSPCSERTGIGSERPGGGEAPYWLAVGSDSCGGLRRVRGKGGEKGEQHTCAPHVGKSPGCSVSISLQLHFWLEIWVASPNLKGGKNKSCRERQAL